MYRKLDESTGNVLAYHVSGKLTAAEVKEIQGEVERAIELHGKARLLCQMADLAVPELGAIWEDIKFTPQYLKGLERLALVGDKAWQEWTAKLSGTLTHADARYFESSQLEEAKAWIRR